MNWAVYALIHSLSRAFFVETNRVYGADPWHLTFWQAFYGMLLLLPATPFMHWPEDGRFYFAATVVAGIMALGYMIQLGLAARRTGRVSGMYMALETAVACILWVLVMPTGLAMYGSDPLMTAGVVAGIAMIIFGMLRIRPADISWGTFAIVAPVGLTYAIAGVTTKIVMPTAELIPSVLTYVFVMFCTMTAVMGAALLFKKKTGPEMKETRVLKAGFMTGMFSVAAFTAFVTSVAVAPNPGYTSALAMLLPVWLLVFHKIMKVEDRANVPAAVLMAGGAGLLVAMAAL